MTRVYAVWFMRKITQSFYLKLAVPALALWLTTFYVSAVKVLENMPKGLDMGAYYNFTISAFSKTEFTTLLLLSVAAVSAVWLVKDSAKNLKWARFGKVAV